MNILILGCGNIGSAFVSIFKNNNNQNSSHVVDLFLENSVNGKLYHYSGIDILKKTQNIIFDIILIAIKPQDFYDLDFHKISNNKTIFISVMAGKTIKSIQKELKSDKLKIARLMPNILIKINKSISVIAYSSGIKFKDKVTILALLKDHGQMIEIKEKGFNEATVIFGCMPAYFFLLSNILLEIGKKYSFDDNLLEDMLLNCMSDAGAFAKTIKQNNDTKEKNIFLKANKMIASKGGITEEILLNLINLPKQLDKAIKLGIKKAKKLE